MPDRVHIAFAFGCLPETRLLKWCKLGSEQDSFLRLLTLGLWVQGNLGSDTEAGSEGAALEAAAALAAVAAMVDGLKAFLSPHLPALLHLLFSSAVLACKQANCSKSAGNIRIQLASFMPPRLLLAPLFAHFEGAVQVRLHCLRSV